MSKTNESKKFCIRCPGKEHHLMSCPVYKGGKVKGNEPWHGQKPVIKTEKTCDCCETRGKVVME